MTQSDHRTAITTLYHDSARALIGAMLREPHMYNSFRIPAVWFQDTQYSAIAEGIEAVIKISDGKTYTPNAVRIKAGVSQAEVSELLTDRTPIDVAYEIFTEKHELYIELLCAEVVDRETNANTIQALQKQIRSERLVMREGATQQDEDIETWAMAKVEGKSPTYPTVPPLKTLIENKALIHYTPTDLAIWAARPGMGKTQFVLNHLNNFIDIGLPGAMFSLEMSKLQIEQRLLAMRTGQNSLKEWDWLSPDEKAFILEQARVIKSAPINIDTCSSLDQIERTCRILHAKGELCWIIVDYIQLVRTPGKKNGNREQEVSEISRALKSLALELRVPVIALSQLSRAVETRGGTKRPQLSDLRESGSLEQDADIVGFLYRPAYYEVLEPGCHSAILLDDRTELQPVEVIIAKNRHGKLYTASVHYTPVRGFIDPPAFDLEAKTKEYKDSGSWETTVTPAQVFPEMPKPDTSKDIPF
jgi:hypothetical protein